MFRVVDLDQGQDISHEGRTVTIGLEEATSQGQVHIGAPKEGTSPKRCPISGDTYRFKEDIKKLPYGAEGTEWTGEEWVVNYEMVPELVTELVWVGVDVTVEAVHVEADGMDLSLKTKPDNNNESAKVERVWQGPTGDGDYVSCAWAEAASRLGNYDDIGDFTVKHGVTILSDEDMIELLEKNGVEPEYRKVSKRRMDRLK